MFVKTVKLTLEEDQYMVKIFAAKSLPKAIQGSIDISLKFKWSDPFCNAQQMFKQENYKALDVSTISRSILKKRRQSCLAH